ncbi:hypothetical protein [Kangiella sediminilitoris]|uniref:Uncharacterized protein n=1 Tax=Kangiella sediminilitoris TaxID=1144748 RepID=A0A1B3B8N0_9GAMM|nr:hypothetical protein [Kangiella sediminilitoris]AOE49153.1 hypothetical protein KS2013_429 [Kangiella sediminilitoris]
MKKVLLACFITLFPPLSFAAAGKDDSWYWLLALAVVVSAGLSTFLVWRSKKLDTFTLKAVGFGAWFWFIIFIEVMCYGFYVGLTK